MKLLSNLCSKSPSLLTSFVVLFRLSSVLLVQTWFVPDEYWQSVEVAHYLAFGYGHLTWEWSQGIRSLVYPLSIAIVFKQLQNFNLDNNLLLVYAPRVMQGIGSVFTSWAELSFIKSVKDCGLFRQKEIHQWLIFLQLGSYFMYYVGTRTLGNTVEMSFALLGLSYYLHKNKGSFLLCVMISTYLRPTCASLWLPFLISFAFTERKWLISFVGLKVFLKCLFVLGVAISLDSWWYREFTLVPLQFLMFNFVNNFSQFYGSHPWHWYFSNALPSLMGPTLLPTLLSVMYAVSYNNTKQQLNEKGSSFIVLIKASTIIYIVSHSLVGHKEIRFLTPIVPLLNILASLSLPNWSLKWKRVFFVLFLSWNVPICLYLSFRHQRGSLDVTDFLRTQITSKDEVLFLMPCHSTPLYSHQHVNASLKFLACPPNLNDIDNYIDEADVFYQNPSKWLSINVSSAPPDYLIFYDALLNLVSNFIASNKYILIGNYFHTDVDQGRVSQRILVFQRRK